MITYLIYLNIKKIKVNMWRNIRQCDREQITKVANGSMNILYITPIMQISLGGAVCSKRKL